MSAKSLDSQVINSIVPEVMEGFLSKLGAPTSPPENKELEIDEYEGRMKVVGLQKFETASFISVVNFYLNQVEMSRHKPKGVFVVYIDSENASKIYKILGIRVDEDEDDISMMKACDELTQSFAEAFKNKLLEQGYIDLLMSEPVHFRNTALRGVEFSPDQKIKFEFSFFYWKRKSIVIEISLADLPRKR
jgi:hypothetical protein